jgi:ATP-binding cassette subfamily C (CFTR/MRP) protein 4
MQTFSWVFGLLRLGWKRDLDLPDLYRVQRDDRSATLGDKLAKEWEREMQRVEKSNHSRGKGDQKKDEEPSLLRAIARVFGPWYAFLGLIALFEECCCRLTLISRQNNLQ